MSSTDVNVKSSLAIAWRQRPSLPPLPARATSQNRSNCPNSVCNAVCSVLALVREASSPTWLRSAASFSRFHRSTLCRSNRADSVSVRPMSGSTGKHCGKVGPCPRFSVPRSGLIQPTPRPCLRVTVSGRHPVVQAQPVPAQQRHSLVLSLDVR